MAADNISIQPTQAVATVNLLADGQDAAAQAGARLAAVGTAVGPAYKFHHDLTQYVSSLKTQAETVKAQLASAQDAVVKTIADLGEQDAQLAQQTSTFLAGVESVAIPAPASTTPAVFPSAATGIG